MPHGGTSGIRAGSLPAAEVRIEVDRDAEVIRARDCEILVGPADPRDARPRQVRWNLCDELLCDELVLIFGRPLDWTGPVDGGRGRLLLVESVFPTPFALDRQSCEKCSGAPQVHFPRGVDLVAWSYGLVLVRGDDHPWLTEARVRLRRVH